MKNRLLMMQPIIFIVALLQNWQPFPRVDHCSHSLPTVNPHKLFQDQWFHHECPARGSDMTYFHGGL